jgi:hypothetical protein
MHAFRNRRMPDSIQTKSGDKSRALQSYFRPASLLRRHSCSSATATTAKGIKIITC